INAILADTVKYPVFTSNADEAIFRYPGTNPYYNPYYNARPSDWNQGDYYTKFFINNLNTWNDPRRAVWATTVTVNGTQVYQGIESGYPVATEYVVGQNSSYSNTLKTLPQLGVMMTWAEVESIKAELALKGYNTGRTAQQHYERGIQASMVQWGVSLPSGYLEQEGVNFDEGASADNRLQQIITQKYYAYFFNDYQAWFEKRRTGYPVLPRGTGIPAENQFPSRIPYPTYLQSLNPDNLKAAVAAMGGDNSNIKVWWDK
ncbi:MAG: SusD/RagB family nutrient-binding outer membrane lipoprotein, partial [Sphingobacteriales bacterium]